MVSITGFLVTFIELYKWLLIARIFLTWLPSLNWDKQPWVGLASVTDPVMLPFRKLIPPIGGMDFSPFLLFFALDILQRLLAGSSFGF